MLRAGLAIRGFTLLEAFIRARTGEALEAVDPNVIVFDDLPERLRIASTLDALRALSFQSELRKRRGEDYLTFVQHEASVIASGASAAYRLSGLAFVHANSNVLPDDLTATLKAIGVTGGWEALGNVAGRAGLGIPALRASFTALGQLRNAAAHDAAADVPLAELQDFEIEITAVALAYDSLLSKAVTRLRQGKSAGGVTNSDVAFRFLRPTGAGRWREVREGALRARRVYDDLPEGWSSACLAAQSDDDVVVELNAAGLPVRWCAGHW